MVVMVRHVVGLLAVLLLAACSPAPPPPVHPLGAGCTWPERVDLDRYAVVLASPDSLGTAERVVLIDTTTGDAAASCSGLTGGEISTEFEPVPPEAQHYYADQRTQLPPLNTDLTLALGPGGVVDLHTGALTPDAAPDRPMVALLSGTQVLRRTVLPDEDRTYVPDEYCIAPRADAPRSECRPLDGEGPGDPAIHPDGTVGWAPRIPVPVTLTTTDGTRTFPMHIQTDGTTVVQARFARWDSAYYSGASPLRRDQGTVYSGSLGATPGQETIAWYELEPTPVVHISALTLAESQGGPYLSRDYRNLGAVHVLDDGSAIGSYEEYGGCAFYRITLDGTMTELARISTLDGTRFATIAHWPEPDTTAGRV